MIVVGAAGQHRLTGMPGTLLLTHGHVLEVLVALA
jgi:hypothetical protein